MNSIPVELFGKALKIDIGGIQKRSDCCQRLSADVAVGDEDVF